MAKTKKMAQETPRDLIGRMAVVDAPGGRMVRQVQAGSTPGLFTLIAWGSAPLVDVPAASAHLVLSISQEM